MGRQVHIFLPLPLTKFAKFANWSQGRSPALKVSEALCCFFAKPYPSVFISKYYNYDVDTISRNSDIFMCRALGGSHINRKPPVISQLF